MIDRFDSKKHISFVLLAAILGVLIGVQIKSPQQAGIESTFIVKELISNINAGKIENRELRKRLEKAEKEKQVLVDKIQKNDYLLKPLSQEAMKMKMSLGYTAMTGPGVSIRILAKDETNLAYMMESKKVLILLINDLKGMGAECISINDQRINRFSGINLAGNHLNINQTAVAPPYEINVIGDRELLSTYLNKNSSLIRLMRYGYNLEVLIEENTQLRLSENELHYPDVYLMDVNIQ